MTSEIKSKAEISAETGGKVKGQELQDAYAAGQTLTAVAYDFYTDAAVKDYTGFTFQWKKDGVVIDGATGQTYVIPVADATNTGAVYAVDITGGGNYSGKASAETTKTKVEAEQDEISYAAPAKTAAGTTPVAFSQAAKTAIKDALKDVTKLTFKDTEATGNVYAFVPGDDETQKVLGNAIVANWYNSGFSKDGTYPAITVGEGDTIRSFDASIEEAVNSADQKYLQLTTSLAVEKGDRFAITLDGTTYKYYVVADPDEETGIFELAKM